MNGTMQCKHKSILLNTPKEQPRLYIVKSFGFFLHDEEFVSKTINDCNVDLEKFPARKVRQLAMKMESSKATVCHIKQVGGYPQAVQINLIKHQHTEISSGKHKKRKSFVQPKQPSHKNVVQMNPQASSYTKNSFDPRNAHKNKDRCSKCGEELQCKPVTSLDISLVFVIKISKHHSSLGDQRLTNYKQEQCMYKREPYAATLKIAVPVMTHSTCK